MEVTKNDVNKRRAQSWTVDPLLWILDNKIKLVGGIEYSIVGHEYQVDILKCNAIRQCARKGAQIGFTELNVLKKLHGMIFGKYARGALYLFPTREEVIDFGKGRFKPLIEDNPCIGTFVKETDSANIKKVGKSMLYLRGAKSTQKIGSVKGSSSQLKSIPVDSISYDEMDEMDPLMIELAHERLSHSDIQEEFFLSTPTIPDYGIDKKYTESDQRVWMIRCDHCGSDTCLELEFPNCLKIRIDGSVYRACGKCGKEIYPCDGRWVAQYPERSKDLVGWWISQLNSIYIDPKKILDMYNDPPNGDLTEFYNSKLGMAYIKAENRLRMNDVYATCGQDLMKTSFHGPSALGIDVGAKLNVVVGYKETEFLARIIYVAEVASFNDVKDIGNRYNVNCAVFDIEPETRSVRTFQSEVSYDVYLCDYSETLSKDAMWDDKSKIVKVNRTEICDSSHNLFTTPGKLIIPRICPEITEFAKQVTNTAKILEENPDTGGKSYRYRKLGADHYRHAVNYFLLGLSRINVAPKLDHKKRKTIQTNRGAMVI